jgi:hypothetical protein
MRLLERAVIGDGGAIDPSVEARFDRDLQRFRVARSDDHRCAAAHGFARGRETDPAGGAGDDDDLPVERLEPGSSRHVRLSRA